MMNDFFSFADLVPRNRGWPWPEDTWSSNSMFGEDGWCRACGVPKRAQSGPMVLQRKSIRAEGCWMPFTFVDVLCVDMAVAQDISEQFDVELRPVEWHPPVPEVTAMQIVIPTIGDAWYDTDQLRTATRKRHGRDGATCPECGVWRWLPVWEPPPLLPTVQVGDVPIAASPEWFGDGWNAFHEVVIRRDLAELLAKASPRDFKRPKGKPLPFPT